MCGAKAERNGIPVNNDFIVKKSLTDAQNQDSHTVG